LARQCSAEGIEARGVCKTANYEAGDAAAPPLNIRQLLPAGSRQLSREALLLGRMTRVLVAVFSSAATAAQPAFASVV